MGLYNDEFDGVGGTYHVVNGKRVRVPEGGAEAPQQDTAEGKPSGEAPVNVGSGIGPAGGAAKSPDGPAPGAAEASTAAPGADVQTEH